MDGQDFDTPHIPSIVAQPTLRDVLEIMTRAVFQAGVSWAQIAKHWNAYRSAFADFDVQHVAAMDAVALDAALATPGVMRSQKKARATVKNAASLLEIERDFGSFEAYIASLPDYKAKAKDFRKRFAFLGEMNVWYVLFRANLAVPVFETWLPTIKGDHPRMREMVALARSQGRSPEREERL